MRLPRASGILLHPTSLPGPRPVGEIGASARAFIDFLAATGQTYWQILPLGPTGYGNSPYQSHSSFAGNRLLIDLDDLVEQGWLRPEECSRAPGFPGQADFDAAAQLKDQALEIAFRRFESRKANPEFDAFLAANQAWLEDFSLYWAIKEEQQGKPWHEWPAELAARHPQALATCRKRLARALLRNQFVQFLFDAQWARLMVHARAKGVKLIGDVPIFVAHDSADVWANPGLFQLDARGLPMVVAGVPPDCFNEDGQLWGNPLYRWDVHARDEFAWWSERLRFLLQRVDLVRIDHFRGFEAYWEIPAGAPTAATGRWVPGPGAPLFEALRKRLGSLPVIAEDLGFITPAVESLRDQFNLPGMKVLQFGFGPDAGSENYLPHRYLPHCVVYTGTHDNDTTVGWFTSTEPASAQSWEAMQAERAFARKYLHSTEEIHWAMIRLAFASVADTAIVPMQDVLGLDGRARMNLPGSLGGNWVFRLESLAIDQATCDRLAELTAVYSRWNGPIPPAYDPHHEARAAACQAPPIPGQHAQTP